MYSFWRPQDQHGWLGQWHKTNFVFEQEHYDLLPDELSNLSIMEDHPEVIESISTHDYNCAEQFMMLGKAYLFDDRIAAQKIANSKNPAQQKAIAKLVNGFDDEKWYTYAEDIVTIGNYLKFSQNATLKKRLLDTGDAILVEGSPYDREWGVGLHFLDRKIGDRKNWKGKNRLGKCLETVRRLLLESAES